MPNKLLLLFIYMCLLTGCTTNLINKNGEMASCQSFGIGTYGMAAAAIGHSMCVSNLKKMGYHKFEIDYGITGIFLNDTFDPQLGALIGFVAPGSPADCLGIQQGGNFLYKANNEIVEDKEHGHDLLHLDSKETVDVVIKRISGDEKSYTVKKLKPGADLGCFDTIQQGFKAVPGSPGIYVEK